MNGTTTIIIPTTAERSRHDSLLCAIDSVRQQANARVEVCVVVNGLRRDRRVLQMLKMLPVRLLELEEASLPAAIYAGCRGVASDYFGFLDDDDIYLQGALEQRVGLLEHSGADFVVSNGINGSGEAFIADVAAIERDPIRAMMVGNWLASCGGLYRSATVGAECFAQLIKHVEWTVVGFRLVNAGKQVAFLDRPTFQLTDTIGSASKQRSWESLLNAAKVVDLMFAEAPAAARVGLKWRRAAAYHHLADFCVRSGHWATAWRMHVSSLTMGGWKYLPFTRHLLTGQYRAVFRTE